MSAVWRGLTYCRQVACRIAFQNTTSVPCKQLESNLLNVQSSCLSVTSVRNKVYIPADKFENPSPFKPLGPSKHGFNPKLFDGGRLPRGLAEPLKNKKKYKPKNRWSRNRAMFGQNDCIDILGDHNIHPSELIKSPAWLRGFNGNEMQRLIRRLNTEGYKIKQLYPTQYHDMWKRIMYLYKKYNRKRGFKHR
ncbi:39S ribosomal protein L51 [Mactra antiquata]